MATRATVNFHIENTRHSKDTFRWKVLGPAPAHRPDERSSTSNHERENSSPGASRVHCFCPGSASCLSIKGRRFHLWMPWPDRGTLRLALRGGGPMVSARERERCLRPGRWVQAGASPGLGIPRRQACRTPRKLGPHGLLPLQEGDDAPRGGMGPAELGAVTHVPVVWRSRSSASATADAVQPWAKSHRACHRSRSRGVGARYMRSRTPPTSSCHRSRSCAMSLIPNNTAIRLPLQTNATPQRV